MGTRPNFLFFLAIKNRKYAYFFGCRIVKSLKNCTLETIICSSVGASLLLEWENLNNVCLQCCSRDESFFQAYGGYLRRFYKFRLVLSLSNTFLRNATRRRPNQRYIVVRTVMSLIRFYARNLCQILSVLSNLFIALVSTKLIIVKLLFLKKSLSILTISV